MNLFEKFSSKAPDTQYDRVYWLDANRYDFPQSTEEPTDEEAMAEDPNAEFDTGEDFYLVVNKDGSTEIIAALPEDMDNEVFGSYGGLRNSYLEGEMAATQDFLMMYPQTLPHIPNSATEITLDMMGEAIVGLEAEREALQAELLDLESSMIVDDEETAALIEKAQGDIAFVGSIIESIEDLTQRVPDSAALNEFIESGALLDAGMTTEQTLTLQNIIQGEQPPVGDYAPIFE